MAREDISKKLDQKKPESKSAERGASDSVKRADESGEPSVSGRERDGRPHDSNAVRRAEKNAPAAQRGSDDDVRSAPESGA